MVASRFNRRTGYAALRTAMNPIKILRLLIGWRIVRRVYRLITASRIANGMFLLITMRNH
jgi:hypothetical protein